MNRDNKILAATLVICVILQLMVAPNIRIALATPNFLLIATVISAILKGPRFGCTVGFIAGLLFDLITTGPFGAMCAILTIAGFLVGRFARGLILESMWMTIALVAICTLVAEFFYVVLLAIMGDVSSFGVALWSRMLPSALYDMVFAIIAFVLLRRFLTPLSGRSPVDSPLS